MGFILALAVPTGGPQAVEQTGRDDRHRKRPAGDELASWRHVAVANGPLAPHGAMWLFPTAPLAPHGAMWLFASARPYFLALSTVDESVESAATKASCGTSTR